jgi:shikimate dehydrogenase
MSPARQPTIRGTTRLVGIVGDPIDQVKSPQTWNPRLAEDGHDVVLVPVHVRAADFDETIEAILRIANLDGLVLTMPFKERIVPHLASISRRAAQVGAVNAARRSGTGEWIGDMFDGVGLIGAVNGLGIALAGLRVGLVGAGGAGSAIAFALAESGVASLNIVDADGDRAEQLAERIADSGAPITPSTLPFRTGEVDLLVNATPVGMGSDDGTPTDVGDLTAATSVVDIVTRPTTPLIAAAERAGCRHAGGAAMVAAQSAAILAFLGLAGPAPANRHASSSS